MLPLVLIGMLVGLGTAYTDDRPTPPFIVISAPWTNGGMIPLVFTCQGSNLSPAISWHSVPPQAKSIVLIMEDPDAPVGLWVHWVLYNIPVTVTNLPQNLSEEFLRRHGISSGKNSWGKTGYGGPCPPSGTHRYFFRIYALDRTLQFDTPPSRTDILQAMEGHIVGEGVVMGRYRR